MNENDENLRRLLTTMSLNHEAYRDILEGLDDIVIKDLANIFVIQSMIRADIETERDLDLEWLAGEESLPRSKV